MTARITRRSFIRRSIGGAGAIVLGTGGNWAVVAAERDAQEWSFPLLGDLHIDHPDHHDLGWLEKSHPQTLNQVQAYSRTTREFTPKLLAAVRRQVNGANVAVPFVVQVGDLIQGLCGSESLATKQANDALELIRKVEFGRPFLFTKGNHDITGPGALQVYDDVLAPSMAEQINARSQGASFSRERDGVLVVFYDAYCRGSLDWFAELLHTKKPRRVLFVIHPPVVPYNARSTWFVYSSPAQAKQRERLLELLGRSGAVVLSGHLHKYSFLVRKTDQGRFVQLGLSSVAHSADATPRDLIEDTKGYGPDLVNLEPKHSPETVDLRREILEAERPLIEQFEYANTWGHAFVRVSGDNIHASVFRGFDREAWKEIDLTGAMA